MSSFKKRSTTNLLLTFNDEVVVFEFLRDDRIHSEYRDDDKNGSSQEVSITESVSGLRN